MQEEPMKLEVTAHEASIERIEVPFVSNVGYEMDAVRAHLDARGIPGVLIEAMQATPEQGWVQHEDRRVAWAERWHPNALIIEITARLGRRAAFTIGED